MTGKVRSVKLDNMSTLQKLGEDKRALEELIEEHLIATDGDLTDIDDIVTEWFQENEEDLEDKIDAYKMVIEGRKKLIEQSKERIDTIKALNKTRQNTIDKLEDMLMFVMESIGQEKIETPENKVWIQLAGGKAPVIFDEDKFKDEDIELLESEGLAVREVKIKPDKNQIRRALEMGENLRFATLGERKKVVRWR